MHGVDDKGRGGGGVGAYRPLDVKYFFSGLLLFIQNVLRDL